MPQAAYPTGQDVYNIILSTGVITDETPGVFQEFVNFGQLAANAADLMETNTNRRFVAALATRTYGISTNPRGILSLGQDLCSDETVASDIVVSANNTVKTLNQDYVLGPDNADIDGKPWTWLQFSFPTNYLYPAANRKPISVTGYWGYSLTVPDDVWTAIAQKAAADACPQLGAMISGGILRIKEGDTDTMFGGTSAGTTSPFSNERSLWNAKFNAVALARARTAY
jgi:hypothetical protein